jgi:hypothetical protein
LSKYQEYNLFFEATTRPLKNELARLKTDNDILQDNNLKMKNDISAIYDSKRWKLITKVADIKNRLLR